MEKNWILMLYLVFFVLGLILIIIQTTMIPLLLVLGRFYDLLIPFVLFISAYGQFRNSTFVIVGVGLIMDCISGGAFGLYSITYLWLHMVVNWMTVFLEAKSVVFLLLMVVCGTVIENLFFIITVSGFKSLFLSDLLHSFITQALWGVFTSPFLIMALFRIHKMLDALDAERS